MVATADLTHFSQFFRGFHRIFFLNDGKILVFSSLCAHLHLINHVKRFLKQIYRANFLVNVKILNISAHVHITPRNSCYH